MSELYKTGIDKDALTLGDILETPIARDTLALNSEQNDNYYASSVGLCPRQAAFNKIGIRTNDPHEVSRELYYKFGNAAEEVVAQRFQQRGILLDRELRIEESRLNLSGRIDFVIEFNGEIHLVELKTCGKLPSSPRKGHKAQLLVYQALTGIEKGIVWYISRHVSDWHNSLLHAPFVSTPTDDHLRSVLTSAATAKAWVERGAVPPKPDYMKKSYCGFCPLKPVCWEGEPEPFHTSVPDPIDIHDSVTATVDSIMADRDWRRNEMRRFYGV